ncbi:hypothetical protein HK405_005054, partial [Cladochytrium tenue]
MEPVPQAPPSVNASRNPDTPALAPSSVPFETFLQSASAASLRTLAIRDSITSVAAHVAPAPLLKGGFASLGRARSMTATAHTDSAAKAPGVDPRQSAHKSAAANGSSPPPLPRRRTPTARAHDVVAPASADIVAHPPVPPLPPGPSPSVQMTARRFTSATSSASVPPLPPAAALARSAARGAGTLTTGVHVTATGGGAPTIASSAPRPASALAVLHIPRSFDGTHGVSPRLWAWVHAADGRAPHDPCDAEADGAAGTVERTREVGLLQRAAAETRVLGPQGEPLELAETLRCLPSTMAESGEAGASVRRRRREADLSRFNIPRLFVQ